MGYSEDMLRFERRTGYFPDEEFARTHCEKVFRKKWRDRSPVLTKTADKVGVRDWIREQGYECILVATFQEKYGILEQINNFPCILKMNNGSGRNIIVRNPLDEQKAKQAVKKWAATPYGKEKGEWCYENIRPGFIIEPLLWETGKPHTIHRLLCFHGVPHYVEAHEYQWVNNRKVKTLSHTMFELPWQMCEVKIDGRRTKAQEPPKSIDVMIDVAKDLSRPFDFVRVDLFEYKGKVKFSELTHYPRSGSYKYTPREFDFELGRLW